MFLSPNIYAIGIAKYMPKYFRTYPVVFNRFTKHDEIKEQLRTFILPTMLKCTNFSM